MNLVEAMDLIGKVATELPEPYRGLCYFVIDDPLFRYAPGAKSHHHNYPGGLAIHTAEVLDNCVKAASGLQILNTWVLFTAAIWHDYLKIRDYTIELNGEVQYTEFKKQIYHISGSAMEFYHQAKQYSLDQKVIDHILHCILAHHGRPEWGSPIQPQTPEALTLHWADCMSAWFENGKYKEKTS